jgi:hypothetical protein
MFQLDVERFHFGISCVESMRLQCAEGCVVTAASAAANVTNNLNAAIRAFEGMEFALTDVS